MSICSFVLGRRVHFEYLMWQGGWESTGPMNTSPVFKDVTGQYIFIRQLGSAFCHLSTGEYPVRKVLHRRARLIDEKKGKYSPVSYWSLSNGDLDSFIVDYDHPIPRPHLYTAYHDHLGPITHNDCHAGNIPLHYRSAQTPIPEFHLIDFGLATPLSLAFVADDNNFLLLTPGNPPEWDIPRLLRTFDKLLATWPPEYQAFLYSGGDPIGAAYRLLLDLDCRLQDLLLRHRQFIHQMRGFSQRLTLPDLQPVIEYVNNCPVTSDFHDAEMKRHQLQSQAYLTLCDHNFTAPKTYNILEKIGGIKDLPGPWHIGYLDPDRNHQVLDLLAVGGKDTLHRPNEDNKHSDNGSAWGDDEDAGD
ncbi:hypothetical protein QBC36DRAFT_384515 [Triangularia setosa]|uniref:Uncharacterized protein n=1 Tax=Triangularia setosa TaxID=2587417 RepID=A0AAN6WEE0_9PEZI|nr:hypothetical protein QBC36DRAFT_384515 [Podospora setosa]